MGPMGRHSDLTFPLRQPNGSCRDQYLERVAHALPGVVRERRGLTGTSSSLA
jgi:hypothetical protein